MMWPPTTNQNQNKHRNNQNEDQNEERNLVKRMRCKEVGPINKGREGKTGFQQEK